MRVVLAVVLGVAGSLVAISPVGAHADLLSSDPADGSALTAPPPAVTLTFSEALMAPTVAVALSDASRNLFDLETPVVDGNTVTVNWPAAATAGAFTVAYRVVSQDGHPIEGAIRLTIEGEAAAPAPAATSAASTAPTPTTAPTSTPPAPADDESSTGLWLAVGTVLVAIAAVLIVTKRKRP